MGDMTSPRPGYLARAVTWLFVFNSLVCLATAASSMPRRVQGDGSLQRREDDEHVILSDCRDQNNIVSSQMAYFNGTPGNSPTDVAVVITTPGQAALWVNSNTSALFTDTGVTFTATLGPRVAEGQYAGNGTNGYGTFSCWARFLSLLYSYDGTTCNQVYDCDHEAAPAVLPTPLATAAAETPTSTPQTTDSGGSGISEAALIGIIVGVVGTLAVAAAGGLFFWYWRRSKQAGHGATCCGLFPGNDDEPSGDARNTGGATAAAEVDGKGIHVITEAYANHDHKKRPANGGIYEMDGQWYRVEMDAGHGKYELDSTGETGQDDKKDPVHKIGVGEGLQSEEPEQKSRVYQAESPVLNNANIKK
ncbi:hypothetical protein B0T17DRAFT_617542 [Bombardia bombarda]|uniref:Uncharacterized protein n=1 Tax=Bombardia bombarda TaxID=252184 RepID=A0AA39X1W4_9PEZI|nr:hypothetical protein B0T17DRAFT_617542 [Bombardia bombarda]